MTDSVSDVAIGNDRRMACSVQYTSIMDAITKAQDAMNKLDQVALKVKLSNKWARIEADKELDAMFAEYEEAKRDR